MARMTQLYDYMHKITGNVCTDWRLSHPLVTSFEDRHGKSTLVNTQAFKVFLNKHRTDGIPGSCQDAGYTWKQLDFDANVKPAKAEPGSKKGVQSFL
mmetsp:Transcript_19931/g.49841  ORF Transcript_19931/g.49841 Transcript_19931/m.49841 type:complete len:97 (+) Transcript_19931:44-334(+)